MARFRLFTYFIREAIVNMTRSKVPNAIAIGMISVSLSIFGIFLLIYGNLNTVARRWSDSVQVIAYVDESITEDQRIQLDARIREIQAIDDVKFVSSEEALEDFKTRLVGHEDLLEGVADANPLPASFEIRLKPKYQNFASVQAVVESLAQIPHLNDFQYGQTWLENLTIVINLLKFIGVFLGIFLFLTIIFIISNTIKLTLYSREEELNIMKFVGATETFIKGPFLAEGIMRGFLGATGSLVIIYLIYQLFLTVLHYSSSSLFMFLSLSFLSWSVMTGILVLGSFLGWCGSLFTLHKFLRTY